MALESATYISDLVSTNPPGGDAKSQGDDHLRLLKSTIKATFPNIAGAVTPTHTQLNLLIASSLGANGYQKLPSGLIVQWGFATSSAAGAQSINYSIAFPTALVALVITPAGTVSTSATTDSQGLSSFTFSLWATAAATRIAVGAFWIALGY